MTLPSSQALAWRLGRHLLHPRGSGPPADIVARLGAVPAYPDTTAEVAIGMRRQDAGPGDLARALDRNEIIKTYAFRGGSYLMTPESAGMYLSLRASGRQWERPSWQEFYQLKPGDWPDFREAVRAAVADGPLTRHELRLVVGQKRRFRVAAKGLVGNADTLIKALMWQGDLCFGPAREGQSTMRGLHEVLGWTGLVDPDEAGPWAVVNYFRTYGPATPEHIHYWLGEGLSAGRKALNRWLDELDDQLVPVDIEGEAALMLAEDLDDLDRTSPTPTVRLLPGADPWVMGPGTADPLIVPPSRRSLMTLGANPVLANGVVAGTWKAKNGKLAVAWFSEAVEHDEDLLRVEASRLGAVTGAELDLVVSTDAPVR
jgi:hypothetical protein